MIIITAKVWWALALGCMAICNRNADSFEAFLIDIMHCIGLHTGGGPVWPSHRLWRDNPEQRAYNNSCPPNKSCSRPAAKVMVRSNPAGTIPLQLCTMIMTNPQKGCQLPGILLQKV